MEGVWQEPAPPGETPGLRYRVTFSDDEATIEINGETTRGTLWLDPERTPPTITITTVLPNKHQRSISGTYRRDNDQLHLRIGPEVFVDPQIKVEPLSSGPLERAPITVTLAKAKK